MTRLLVIDDSVAVRRLVTRALAREPTVEVVAAMRNSHAAVVRAEVLRPDVVLLDAEVAGEDGSPTLAELRRHHPGLRAVMRGDGAGLSEEWVRRELLTAIRGGARPELVRRARARPRPEVVEVDRRVAVVEVDRRAAVVEAIVVVASTGGPDALDAFLGGIPADLPIPVIVVQHMPADFTRLLADRLDRRGALRVTEAKAGELVSPGHVYIAPGGHHLVVEPVHGRVALDVHDGPPENSCRPAADVLFRSAASVYGAGLLAVVLTGMGRDGLRGAEAVRRTGGSVIVQSAGSSVIASMPGAVAEAGLANEVVALESLSARVTARVSGER